jgi:hypothetical protein
MPPFFRHIIVEPIQQGEIMSDDERETGNHETPLGVKTGKELPDSVESAELSRRRFLYIVSAAGITPVVYWAEKNKF